MSFQAEADAMPIVEHIDEMLFDLSIDSCEHLRGILRSIEPLDGDLIINVHGLRRIVPGRLEGELSPLIGKFIHILRIDIDYYIIREGRIRGDEGIV
jgi:hypothetical protein